MGRLISHAGEERQLQQSIEMKRLGPLPAVQQAVFQLPLAPYIGLLAIDHGLGFPAPDPADHHVALHPFLKIPPPRLARPPVPAFAQAGHGHARLGKDFHPPGSAIGLAPADGRGAGEFEPPTLGRFVQRAQLRQGRVPHPGVTAGRPQHLGDGEVDGAQADDGLAAVQQVLHEDAEDLVVQQAQAQPALVAGPHPEPPMLLPVAVEGREAEGFALLGVMHVRGQVRVHGLDGGVERGVGHFPHARGQGAALLGGEFDDQGVECRSVVWCGGHLFSPNQVSAQYFGAECVALTQASLNSLNTPGQCDGLPRFIEQVPNQDEIRATRNKTVFAGSPSPLRRVGQRHAEAGG